MTGYGAASLDGFIDECLQDGERGLVRFIDSFLDVADEYRERMIRRLAEAGTPDAVALLEILISLKGRRWPKRRYWPWQDQERLCTECPGTGGTRHEGILPA